VASIQTTFDYIHQPCTYDLYRDAVLYRNNVYSTYQFAALDDTWDFFIRAVNRVGHTDSAVNTGTALPANYPPGNVTDFIASDDLRREIRIDFTPAIDAGRYNLYRNDVIFLQDVYPGMRFDADVDMWTFRIEAINGKGSTFSNYDDGSAIKAITSPPSAITDFTASDDLVNSIQINFTRASQATRHDLYRAGLAYKTKVNDGDVIPTFSGTWDFYVIASNLLGSTTGNVDSGTAIASNTPPSVITDFTASDDRDNQILIDFSLATDAARYDLYRSNEKVEEDVTPGYVYYTEAGTWTFHVRALNLKGTTSSNENSGTALATDLPPTQIEDFDATDNLTEEIVMTFTPADGASSHDLWRDDALFVAGIQDGYILSTTGGTWTFNVVAHNSIGSTPSNTNDGTAAVAIGKPGYDSSLLASDNQIGKVTITWNGVADADYYDVYVNDSLLQSHADSGITHSVSAGSRVYNHRAVNAGGWTASNDNVGTSLDDSAPPIGITDFAASSCYMDRIIFTWTNVPDATQYDIWDSNSVIAYDANSGESVTLPSGTSDNFRVRAIGEGGSSNSNYDIGFTWSSGELVLTDAGSIYGGVQVPADTTISVCLIGGGGSGGATSETTDPLSVTDGFGGFAGEIVQTSLTLGCGSSKSYSCGYGGLKVSASGGNMFNAGLPGSATSISTFTANGGLGGDKFTNNPGEGYLGNGDSKTVCGNSVTDGEVDGVELNPGEWFFSYGGEAGAGDGGDGDRLNGNVGLYGSGGGGAAAKTIDNVYSGAGGAGYIKLTW